jgi:hypothetical protein
MHTIIVAVIIDRSRSAVNNYNTSQKTIIILIMLVGGGWWVVYQQVQHIQQMIQYGIFALNFYF